jgi:hypothetical protein
MHSILGWIRANLELLAAVGGVIAVASSLLASLLSRIPEHLYKNFETVIIPRGQQISKSGRTLDGAYRPPRVPTPSQVAKERVLARIEEARDAFRGQTSSAKWSGRSGNLLTVGQYIIGGLLASSFVQESLSPRLVGSLGLLVLLASLIKQHFHPEASAETACKKAAQLKGLIRTSEDQLAILDAKIASGQDHTDAMISLLMTITERLTEIDTPEAIEQRPELPDKSA